MEDVRKQLLEPPYSKIDVLGAQDERVYVEFSTEKLKGLDIEKAAIAPCSRPRTQSFPRAWRRPGTRRSLCVFRAPSDPSRTSSTWASFRARTNDPFGRHRKTSPRPGRPGAADLPRQRTRRHRSRDRHADRRRRPRPRAQRRARHGRDQGQPARWDRARRSSPTNPLPSSTRWPASWRALWGGDRHCPWGQLVKPGVARGRRCGLSISRRRPAASATMAFTGIDLQRISLVALIIALGLLVDDAMITSN